MRYYGADDIISLPRLGTAGAVALGQGVITAAKLQADLPPLIMNRLTQLEAAYAELHEALSEQERVLPDPSLARSADLAEDQAWSAFHDWLQGWTKLPAANAEKARAMYPVLFPSRLKFTKLQYKLEWAEADARLTRIGSEGFDRIIEGLGGKPLLDHLRQTHNAYGAALGITAQGADPSTIALREPLDRFLTKLRAYVLAVAAHADEADELSVTLTESLLLPLHQWKSRPADTSSASPPTSPAAAPVMEDLASPSPSMHAAG